MAPSDLNEEMNFAYSSFAFAAVTGFCIGGTALANVIGIPYINKRLSLSNAVKELTTFILHASIIVDNLAPV